MSESNIIDNAMELANKWCNFSFRHNVYAINSWGSLHPKQRKTFQNLWVQEFLFLERIETDPGLYRYLKKQFKNIKWIKSHIFELSYLILIDLLHPGQPTIKDVESFTFNNEFDTGIKNESQINSRQLRRLIRDYYPEIFFTPLKVDKKKIGDKRRKPFRSIFTEIELPDEETMKNSIKLEIIQELALAPHKEEFEKRRALHAELRMADPDDIEEISLFWKNLKRIIYFLEEKFVTFSNDKIWLVEQIKGGYLAIDILCQLLWEGVALRWFRLKSDKERKNLLYKRFPLHYTKSDAERAISVNLKWFKKTETVVNLISRGALKYLEIGKPKIGQYLFLELFKQVQMDKTDQALCHHNFSLCYQGMSKPKKMLMELRKAMVIWDELGNVDDVGITYSFISEAYFHLGMKEKSNKARETSKKIFLDEKIPIEKRVKGYLFMADCAQRIGDRDWEREALELGLETAKPIENAELFLYFSQRLYDLTMGKKTYIAEQEPGKIKHPPEFETFKPSSRSYIAITPRIDDD